jgi:cyanophycin synthetase
VRTIRQLIDELNAEPDRDKLRFSPITFDDELEDHLDALGYGLESIPAPGEIIAVRATGHVSRGGIPIDVTDLVHPDNRRVSEEAARAIGLEIAGIDFVSPDISKSYREIGGRIVEVNSRPGIGMHLWPREGKSRDMGVAILRHMYPDPASACVPFLLVAGDRGRGSVARFTDSMLRAKGLTVGLSLKQGAYINGQPLDIPEDKLQHAPNILLRQPLTEAVAAAVSLGQVAKHGLGLQKCDAVSLVSLDSEKISDEYVKGLEVLLKANRGPFVVSSKNHFARQALSSVDRSRIVLIAADSRDSEVSDHLAIGGAAVVRRWSKDMIGLQFAFVDAGNEVVSAQMPSLSGARQSHIEAAMHAFALTHTIQLG